MQLDYPAIGRRIQLRRKQKHMTQANLGKAAEVSASLIRGIERGASIPSLETIFRISKILNVSVESLLAGVPSAAGPAPAGTHKVRMLNDIMHVLYKYSDEWLHKEAGDVGAGY
ncbi:MAG: helix-turn-helix domain-containing protein [Firmicutes bacterium]|nr:helix-turn-helix domain-containing protein [Bacillota bacterium]